MKKTAELVKLAAAGYRLILDAREYTASELLRIASAAPGGKRTIIIDHMSELSAEQLMAIGMAAGDAIIFYKENADESVFDTIG